MRGSHRGTLPLAAVMLVPAFAGCGEVAGVVDAGPSDGPPGAPVVTLTATPDRFTPDTAATFEFTASETSTFSCSLDGAAAEGCTSPFVLAAVAFGPHRFEVVATDDRGDVGSAAYAWHVTPPCVTSEIEVESITPALNWALVSGASLHGGMGKQATIVDASFTTTFEGKGLTVYFEKGSNLHTFDVQVDALAPVTVDAVDVSFTFQNPAVIATGLVSGPHTVAVTCTSPNCQLDYFAVSCD